MVIVGVLIAGLLIGNVISGQAIRGRPIIEDGGGGCTDNDGDKFFYQTACGTLKDCNDKNPNVNPSAAEICGNGVDENCDRTDRLCKGYLVAEAKKNQYGINEKIELR